MGTNRGCIIRLNREKEKFKKKKKTMWEERTK